MGSRQRFQIIRSQAKGWWSQVSGELGAYLEAGKLGRNWCLPEVDQHPAPLSPKRDQV